MDKNEYLKSVGKALVESNGKQKFYTKEQLQKAQKKVSESSIWDSIEVASELLEMSSSFFLTAVDFIEAFSSSSARYLELKAEAAKELSSSSLSDWGTSTEIDLDMSWLELGDVFEGLGDAFGKILEILE